MPLEKQRNTVAIMALIISFLMMLVTLGSLLFANKTDYMTKAEVRAELDEIKQDLDKFEKRNGAALTDMAGRLARLEQMHGPGGHP